MPARTERKSGAGYTGFTCYAAPDVTLEADLLRRDLTVNALARMPTAQLSTPTADRTISVSACCAMSPRFSEDPLRVLRVARFAARYAHLGFRIAEETRALMAAMVEAGELAHLTPERVWKETESALTTRPAGLFPDAARLSGSQGAVPGD